MAIEAGLASGEATTSGGDARLDVAEALGEAAGDAAGDAAGLPRMMAGLAAREGLATTAGRVAAEVGDAALAGFVGVVALVADFAADVLGAAIVGAGVEFESLRPHAASSTAANSDVTASDLTRLTWRLRSILRTPNPAVCVPVACPATAGTDAEVSSCTTSRLECYGRAAFSARNEADRLGI